MKGRLSRLALGALLVLSGCAEWDYLRVEVISAPGNADISSSEITLDVGSAAVVYVDPESSVRTDYSDNGGVVELRSTNSSVLEVREVDGRDRWAFIGRWPGDACVEIIVKGEYQECIPAVVRSYD